MGCVKTKPKANYEPEKSEHHATATTLPRELEQVAELPFRAKTDDADLVSSLLLFIQGKELMVTASSQSYVYAVVYKTTENG